MIAVGPLRVCVATGTVEKEGLAYPLSRRAVAILEALIAARGKLVSKAALMEHAWPDTIVEENNLQVHISALRRALGHARDLLRTVAGDGYLLLPEPEPAPGRPGTWSQGLPFVDTLFGREAAVAELLSLLGSHQTVTLTGAGGIGKTSLAVELCRDPRNPFTSIRFLRLAPLATEREAREAVLSLFADLAHGNTPTLDDLAEHLAHAQCLVVLDNCEHLIDTAASIARKLTSGNPGVRVLATSRESLGISGERLHAVKPLACPPAAASCDQMLAADAIRLFLHRMRRQSAGYTEDQPTLTAISDICRRLDGLPLAIELAAARAATLGLDTVRRHLDDRLSLLTGGSKDVLPRHQTLRAVFEWSYRLLPEVEQIVFRQTGIFVDGFTLDAALAVVAPLGLTYADVAAALAGLVARSLVIREPLQTSRFRQLESARAYALALLDDNGETGAVLRAHAAFFQAFFDAGVLNREGRSIAGMIGIFDPEKGNLRAALTWAFGPGGSEALGLELACTAVPLLYDLSWLAECTHWAKVALDALARKPRVERYSRQRLKLVSAYAAALAYTEGPGPVVYDAWREARIIARHHNDNSGQLRAIWGLWNTKQYADEPVRALDHARLFALAARDLGGPLHAALSRRLIGIALHYSGQHRRAEGELLAALRAPELAFQRWTTTGVRIHQTAVTQATLARVRWFLGERASALSLAGEAASAAQDAGHETTLAYVLIEATIPLAILNAEPAAALRAIELLRSECRQAGLNIWLQCCDAFEWICRAQQGPLDAAGLRGMERAVSRLAEGGYLAALPLVLGEQAKALGASGQPREAMAVIQRALDQCSARRSWWYFPVLDRIAQALTASAGRSSAS
ncbi:hypothetical protein BTH42_23565 [Burkholderia sp. SRS-W-2-2016]|uniref:ATP-binding protein n=1 Tax=Burkholderia sp. SRS-W-2-2016 TaxID=1926878 RepID=UPI00094AE79A|nr:winged helix-turn-helix domain-containing protein [Burkholderia sp. SRS-W-2-2016]OLL29235.1 hypothetical protein BTH42_23565 [Burkholderia sp. SRS-W-2-2016]